MSYNSTTWQTGDTVTANKLNNIEQGIITLDTALNENSSNIGLLETNLGNLDTLETTTKSSIVAAINEVLQSGGGSGGGGIGQDQIASLDETKNFLNI